MDPLSALELGARLPFRKVKRAAELSLGLLITGWAFQVPVVHPFVQSVLDERARRWAEAVWAAID